MIFFDILESSPFLDSEYQKNQKEVQDLNLAIAIKKGQSPLNSSAIPSLVCWVDTNGVFQCKFLSVGVHNFISSHKFASIISEVIQWSAMKWRVCAFTEV